MGNEREWTEREKLVASILSWGIILSIAIIIIGGMWTALEFIINFGETESQFAIIDWFINQDWLTKTLIIGGLIMGTFIGVILFSIFIRKGQRFILRLLFKIDEESKE